ncbi:CNTN6 [Mytilus coruscus]|uniref:CNTN6 n=1 Tax=Mytilus coruscus TaxID=42192 RepID=A0A6J7ZV87_MYTCO|nr:CNTN6 [Mytilus coruscus]
MLESLKRFNPKLFYTQFSSKRKVKPKATRKGFFDHFKRIASEINSEENSRNGNSINDEIPVYEELDCVITNKEILCAISSLKRSKGHAKAISEVHINDNITAKAYSNGNSLKCSFTLENGDNLLAIALTAQNGTLDNFEEIAGFRINTKPQFTSFGMDLFGNETTFIKFEETQKAFMLAFNNLTCRHERQYKCLLYFTSSTILPKLIKSDTMWISVTVLPSKPEIHLPKKVNDLISAKRNTRSATLAPKSGTHERDFIEGDNITFMCEGDVGRPKGRFLWQKIFSSDGKFNYSNISTDTIPEFCSYDGNSTLTIQVTGDDNQARIRCVVKSELPNGTRHVDSEPLLIHFKEGDSVQLKCKANGNPNPSYSWTKGNSSGEIIVDNDTLLINKVNISDSGLYTCDTRNLVDGIIYSESISTYINIANKSTTPSRTTSRPSGSDNRKVQLIAGTTTGGVAVFVILLVGIRVSYKKRHRQNKETNSEDNRQKEDTYADLQEGVYDKPGERRHKQENNRENYDVANVIRPFSPQPVEYAQVNEATKLRNKKNHNGLDQQTVDTSAETQEWINNKAEERHQTKDENADHFDTTKKQQTNRDPESSRQYNQIGSYINRAFEREQHQ